MPSPATGESELLRGGRLEGHLVDPQAADPCDPLPHGLPVGSEARLLAQQGRVEMIDHSAPAPHQMNRVGQEPVRRGAAPLRVARREVDADVALGQGAQQGIRERVQDHIPVRVGDHAPVMGHPDPAEPDMIPLAEGMNVEAGAEAGHMRHERILQPPLGLVEIGRMGQLDIVGLAVEHVNRHPGPLRQRPVIGERMEALACGSLMRFEDGGEPKRLRRLDGPQGCPFGSGDDLMLRADDLDRVGHRRSGHGGSPGSPRLDGAADEGRARKRPGGIVDEDEVGRAVGERLQAKPHRILPGFAAEGVT
jgi:hypothetical protein